MDDSRSERLKLNFVWHLRLLSEQTAGLTKEEIRKSRLIARAVNLERERQEKLDPVPRQGFDTILRRQLPENSRRWELEERRQRELLWDADDDLSA